MEKSAKIFLVDDDLYSLNLYQQTLANLGYENISLFLNGTICLNNLQQKPVVIFLDHNMDELNGFEVLKKIKRFDPNIYVVIVSSQENMQIAIDALKYGAFDYIIKGDNDIEKMAKVIERVGLIEERMRKTKRNFIQKLLSIF